MFQTMAMNSEFTKDNSLISSIRLVFCRCNTIIFHNCILYYICQFFLTHIKKKRTRYVHDARSEKEKVAQLLFIETFGMGIVSIIIGILVGMLLASVAGNF